jgi:hypothetical protein
MSNNQNGISRMSGFFTRRTNILALLLAASFFAGMPPASGQAVRFESDLTGSQPPGQNLPVPTPPNLMDENCFISVLNRTTQVQHDGTWLLPTVPANFGPVRARATCVRDGVTIFGQSDLFTVGLDESVNIPPINLGNVSPIPLSLTLSAPLTAFNQAGQTSPLSVTATFADGTTQNITAAGTQYSTSNAAIANVNAAGVISAVSSGTAIVQATNEGAQGILKVQVTLSVDSDGDGIPDDAELRLGLNPHDPSDALLDPDHDGLTNLEEFQLGTDPHNPDTDGDGLLDGQEVKLYHSNPTLADTDGDGIPDGVEVKTGSNPTDGTSFALNKALSSIEVTPPSFALTVNSIQGQASSQLSIKGHLIDGTTVLDLTPTSKGTQYTSSDLNICNFGSPDGNVFAGNSGSCTITISNNGFTATSTGVVSAFSPVALSSLAIPGFANDIDVNGNFAYIAAGSSGLVIVDVSNRTNPTITKTLSLPGNANGVKLAGNLAIVAAGASGIHAVDITNPAAPVLKGTLSTAGTALDVTVSGSTAYVANTTGLFLANISNPASMSRLSSLTLTGQVRGVAVDAQRQLAVVTASTGGLYLVDVSHPETPALKGQLAIGDAHDVALKDNYAYVANYHTTSAAYQSSLVAVDISDPTNPLAVSSLTNQTLSGNLNDLAISGNFALGADVFFVNGIPIADISSPTSLQARATLNFTLRDDNGMGIAADGSYVYLTTDHNAIDKFNPIGDGRLYIGQYLAVSDTKGVPPTVAITSPVSGNSVFQGSVVPFTAAAIDDVGIAAVTFQVNGQTVFTATSAPYQFSYSVPANASSLTFSASATDFGGNVGKATDVVIGAIPDPGTTVIGRLINSGVPVANTTVTVNGNKSSITGADGRFTITAVPTALGNIVVTTTLPINGFFQNFSSVGLAGVPAGTTDIGDFNITPITLNFEGIPGATPMGNSSGSAIPPAARISTQYQAQGATFSSDSPFVGLVQLGLGHATSGTNGVGGATAAGTLSYASPTIVTFSVPGNPALPGVTDKVSIRGDFSPGSGTITLQAFDINGNLIGTDTKTDSGGTTVTVGVRGIHSFSVAPSHPDVAFDDVSFDPITPAN